MRHVVTYLFNGTCILLFKHTFTKSINFVQIGRLTLKKLKKFTFTEMANPFLHDNHLTKCINGFSFNLTDGHTFKTRGI